MERSTGRAGSDKAIRPPLRIASHVPVFCAGRQIVGLNERLRFFGIIPVRSSTGMSMVRFVAETAR
jgi:hypothetical protein